MLTIRLQRIGKKKQPSYRVIISEKARDTQGRHLEQLGVYNPTSHPKMLQLNTDRVKYWLSVGASTSETMHNLLLTQGIVSGKKERVVHISKKRAAKKEKKAAVA